MVNSRNMASWKRADKRYIATEHGFVTPQDSQFGPVARTGFVASEGGFRRAEVLPKVDQVAEDIAQEVMSALSLQH